MNYYPPTVRALIRNLSKLPGVGEKTAERLTMHILKVSEKEAAELAESIRAVKEKVRLCSQCFVLSDADVCTICCDHTRDAETLCVVEQPGDMMAIEKSGAYAGMYHVLQGALSPIEGVGPDDIKIRELIERVREGKVTEVVLATSTSVEGEATASYIARLLEAYPVKVTRIASGVPMGGDLKYVDPVTLRRSLESRRET